MDPKKNNSPHSKQKQFSNTRGIYVFPEKADYLVNLHILPDILHNMEFTFFLEMMKTRGNGLAVVSMVCCNNGSTSWWQRARVWRW